MANMMTLAAQPRAAMNPRALRRAQLIPGVLYGPGYEARVLQFDAAALRRVLRQAGHSHLIELTIEGTADKEIVLVREVQRDPVTSRLLHIDLYRTQAGEAVRLTVPLVHVGEAPVVEVGGVVLSLLDELEIECLPRDVPEAIHVDLSTLVDMHSVITVADLAIPEGVTVLTDPETDVVRVSLPTKMEEVVEAGAEEVEGAEGPEETEGSESRE